MCCNLHTFICGYVQICYTFWTDFGICSPGWDIIPWLCYNCRSCHNWASSDHSVVMDGTQSAGDSWGTLWLPFPMEPLQLLTFIWRVSWNISLLLLAVFMQSLLIYSFCGWNGCSIIIQCWFSWLSSPFALYQVWQLFINFCLHGQVSFWHIPLKH